ncbi:chorismate-binding protein [Curtobacterium sp. MCPF17_052]|uniref:chorismate-binding protein n=1 Tax=Curtobacterium sp. MCPF17_052 TaxID=2175655 RepID=UPI0024E03F5D|nr:chorismate-binding protein [Curtobacterium sp. MCPF17_052]WIB13106.1 chorismate-binding protein [Curtobacterium sp. MCPF17_052]
MPPGGTDAESDRVAAETLAASTKDLEEHAFAISSLVASLRPIAADLRVDPEPFRLQLPNVWHLASDVEAVLPAGVTALDVADVLHPTAAVAGTPHRRRGAARRRAGGCGPRTLRRSRRLARRLRGR